MPGQSLTLKPATHGKLGIIHCGVTREGFIAVGGEPRTIAEGEEILFERVGIRARRSGNECVFIRTTRSRRPDTANRRSNDRPYFHPRVPFSRPLTS